MAYLLGKTVQLESAAQKGCVLRVAAHKAAGSLDLTLPNGLETDFDFAWTYFQVIPAVTGQEGLFSFKAQALSNSYLRVDMATDWQKPRLYLSNNDNSATFGKEATFRLLPGHGGDDTLVTIEPLVLPGWFIRAPAPSSATPEGRLAQTEATSTGGTPVILSKNNGRIEFSSEAAFDIKVVPKRMALETLPAPPVDTPFDLECIGIRSKKSPAQGASFPPGDFVACEPFRVAMMETPGMRLAQKQNRKEARTTRLMIVASPTGTSGYFGIASALHPGRILRVEKAGNRFRMQLVNRSEIPAGKEGEASFRFVKALNAGILYNFGAAALKKRQEEAAAAQLSTSTKSKDAAQFVPLSALDTSESALVVSSNDDGKDKDFSSPVLFDLSSLNSTENTSAAAATPTAATASSVTVAVASADGTEESKVDCGKPSDEAESSTTEQKDGKEKEGEEAAAEGDGGTTSASSSSARPYHKDSFERNDFGCVSIECEALPGNFLRAGPAIAPTGHPTTGIFLHHYREYATRGATTGPDGLKKGRYAEASFILRLFSIGADIDCEPGIPPSIERQGGRSEDDEDDSDGEDEGTTAPAPPPTPAKKKSCFKRYFCCCLGGSSKAASASSSGTSSAGTAGGKGKTK
jgi:Alpha-L-arabinofuranosidase B (ABFB) domain